LVNGTLGGVLDLSATGQDARNPHVAVDPQGNAYHVWDRWQTPGCTGPSSNCALVQTRVRAVGGALSAVQDLNTLGNASFEPQPQVAVDPQGNAFFTWVGVNGPDVVVKARRRFANGTLSAAQGLATVGPDGFSPQPQLAIDPTGTATFVWRAVAMPEGNPNTDILIQTRRHTAEGLLSAVQDVSVVGDALGPQVAVDRLGNATFVWSRSAIIQTRRRVPDGTLSAVQDLTA
jgi:hypothetical protein